MREAVIVDAVRTPVGRGKPDGALSSVHPVTLTSAVLAALAARSDLDPMQVEDVIWGCVTQSGEQAGNVGRWGVLGAGWPDSVPATTVDRACGSSQQAIHFAAAGVMAGHYDVVVAGGVESMSRVPMGYARDNGPGTPRGPQVRDRYPSATFDQGLAAEQVASRWNLSREELDEHSARSHRLAAAAVDAGAFDDEIVPVSIHDPDSEPKLVTRDEGIRRETTLEALGRLRTPFKHDGVITAGNASQISDGAAGVLIMSLERATELGLTPRARFHSFALAGVDPEILLTGPIPATEKVLKRAGLGIEDIGAYEVNEAFASVSMAWLASTGADLQRLNSYGGAIALGHPLGASGARLTTTLLTRMRATGERYGLQAICENGGMANAMILELLS